MQNWLQISSWYMEGMMARLYMKHYIGQEQIQNLEQEEMYKY